MASIAALQICEGVLKSGSPALRELTSRPSRASSFAFAEIFRVLDFESCCANVEIIVFQFLKVKLPKWAILFYPAFIQFGTGSGCIRGGDKAGGRNEHLNYFVINFLRRADSMRSEERRVGKGSRCESQTRGSNEDTPG